MICIKFRLKKTSYINLHFLIQIYAFFFFFFFFYEYLDITIRWISIHWFKKKYTSNLIYIIFESTEVIISNIHSIWIVYNNIIMNFLALKFSTFISQWFFINTPRVLYNNTFNSTHLFDQKSQSFIRNKLCQIIIILFKCWNACRLRYRVYDWNDYYLLKYNLMKSFSYEIAFEYRSRTLCGSFASIFSLNEDSGWTTFTII